MNARVACGVARRVHTGQITRFGEPLIDHVERVARSVPAEDRALAYLHDVLERSDGAQDLLERVLSDDERSVLGLLTRGEHESYRSYVIRIARAGGDSGRIARTIKLADLDDHLRHRPVKRRTPDYRWARRTIVASQLANGETPDDSPSSPDPG